MKIIKECKVELAASTDAERPSIGAPYLDITDGKGTLVATDGRILVHMPVEITEADTAGYVTADSLKAPRKTPLLTIDCAKDSLAIPTGATFPRPMTEKFPNWRQVVPTDYEKPAMTISLDAKLLWQLAQAMGTQGVRLVIKDAVSPLLVYPSAAGSSSNPIRFANPDACGVICPLKSPKLNASLT